MKKGFGKNWLFLAPCPTRDKNVLVENVRNWIFNEPERSLADFSVSPKIKTKFITCEVKVWKNAWENKKSNPKVKSFEIFLFYCGDTRLSTTTLSCAICYHGWTKLWFGEQIFQIQCLSFVFQFKSGPAIRSISARIQDLELHSLAG